MPPRGHDGSVAVPEASLGFGQASYHTRARSRARNGLRKRADPALCDRQNSRMWLLDMPSPEQVLYHPRHQAAQEMLGGLIGRLRACETNQDGYEFQNELLDRRLAVEEDRGRFRQAIIRIESGKQPKADTPTPQTDLNTTRVETWQLELEVCNRVIRQLRCVGDALAWRVFGFDRRHIIARCRNQSPGLMGRNVGLQTELEYVERVWRDDAKFALLHDLTNCLRIGDLTVFADDGPKTLEIKASAKAKTGKQNRRINEAELAILNLGPLPGDNGGERLYDLEMSFKTHLSLLTTGMGSATSNGIFAAKVPGGRALVVADIYGFARQGWTGDEFADRIQRKRETVIRRAGLGPELGYIVAARSVDSVANDPTRVPFAVYPLDPMACARLIGDLAFFDVFTDGLVLEDLLNEAGISAEWVRTPKMADLVPGEVLMRIKSLKRVPLRGTVAADLSRTLEVCRSELDKYLIELIEKDTWIEGVRYLAAGKPLMPRHPWPYYKDEWLTWQ
jgi:hypothetical protein